MHFVPLRAEYPQPVAIKWADLSEDELLVLVVAAAAVVRMSLFERAEQSALLGPVASLPLEPEALAALQVVSEWVASAAAVSE